MVFEWFNRTGAANQRGSHPWSNPVCSPVASYTNLRTILIVWRVQILRHQCNINDEKFKVSLFSQSVSENRCRNGAEMAVDGRWGIFLGRTVFTTKLTRRFADLIFQSTYVYQCMSYKSQVIKYKLCLKSQVYKVQAVSSNQG